MYIKVLDTVLNTVLSIINNGIRGFCSENSKRIRKILLMPHKCHTFNSHYGLSKTSFLSIKEASNLLGISVSTINRGVEKGTFPPKHTLSPQRVGFLKYQIEQWIDGERSDW